MRSLFIILVINSTGAFPNTRVEIQPPLFVLNGIETQIDKDIFRKINVYPKLELIRERDHQNFDSYNLNKQTINFFFWKIQARPII